MGLSARQQTILAELRTGDYVEVKALARRLDVDGSTIRRDLQAIGNRYEIERFHGGVRIRQGPFPDEALYGSQVAVAKAMRRLLGHGESLALGAGPTAEHLVPLLSDLEQLRVVTTSLRLAERLDAVGDIDVHLVGGTVRAGEGETYGDDAAQVLERIDVDWAVVEVEGVHHHAGLTTDATWRVPTLRAMLAAGQRRCVLAPSSAFDRRRLGHVAEVSTADLLITDEHLMDANLPAFQGRVVRASVHLTGSHGPR